MFSKKEISRITEELKEDGSHLFVVDMHGLTTKKAKKFLKNLIAINKEGYDLCVIHGYIHGTAIREMIYKDNLGERVIKKIAYPSNHGRTLLKICAA